MDIEEFKQISEAFEKKHGEGSFSKILLVFMIFSEDEMKEWAEKWDSKSEILD